MKNGVLLVVAAMGVVAGAGRGICAEKGSSEPLSWQVMPCWGGGYVQGTTLCPSDPHRRYMYVDVGGPYRSDDAGKSWRPLHGNMSVEMRERGFDEVRSLSVDPRDADSVVILGGASGDVPGGFAVTRDGGGSWRVTGDAFAYGNGPKRMEGFCLARNPFDPDELVGGEDRSGIFVSRDNGESWERTGPTNVWFTDVRYDATVTGRVYASSPRIPTNELARCWQVGASCRTPRQFGFFRSDDGARTWRRLSDESPAEIAQIPGDGRIVGIFGRQHVKISADGGMSWLPFEDGLYISAKRQTEPWAGGNYYAFTAGRDFWLIGDGNGNIYRRGRTDGKWTLLPQGRKYAGDPENEPRLAGRKPEEIRMTALMTIVTDPEDDRHWMTTDWFELWETYDAGATWTTRVKGVMQLVSYDIAFDPNSESNICCCLYDMGAFLTFDGGRTFHPVKYAGEAGGRKFPNNIGTALYSARTPGLVLAAGARGWDVGLWRSRDAGRNWEPLEGKGLPPLKPDAHVVSTIVEDRDGSFLVTVSGKPVAGEGGIYRSRDGGDNWSWEGQGLASVKGFDFGLNLSQACWPRLALSSDGTAVAGGHRGNWELLSRDVESGVWKRNGLTWPDWRRFPLAADPHTPGRFLRGGPGDTVESTDGGKTWHVFGPLKGQTCRSFAFDERIPGLVAFGCRNGVFVSSDGGKTVRELKAGLGAPSGSSRTIKLDRGRLFFLTSGSGVYRFAENLAPGNGFVRQFLVVGGQDFGKAEFERLYLRNNPGEKIEMIDAVVDDSAIVRWLPDGDCFKAAMEKAKAASARGQVVGILWHQGEADAGSERDAAAYGSRLEQVVSAFRKDFDAPVPFIASGCGDFVHCHVDGEGRPDRAFAGRIDDITKETMGRLPRCRYATAFNVRGNCRDDLRFSPSCLLEMGARVYRQWTLLDNRRIGKFRSRDYEVLVDGRTVDVIATPRNEHWRSPGAGYELSERGSYSYAPFVLARESEVEVRSAAFDLSRAEILPTSKGVKAVRAEKGRLVFRMKPGQTLVVEPNGREQALVLAANPLDPAAPRAGNARLRYFGPGYHRAGFIELKDGESVYLADGAWVEGLIYGRGKDIGVFGPGVISGAPYDWRTGPSKFRAEPGVTRTGAVVTLCGENVFVRDVTIHSGWVYNLAFNEVTNAVVDNVKVIGGRCLNDDGIDPCRAKDVVIRNSFVHTRDDCIAPKFWIENLTVSNCTLWTDNANAVRVGFECDPPETKTVFRDIVFRDIDILHLSDMRRRFTDFWAFSALTVEAANDQPFRNILFDGVRVHDSRPGEQLIDVRTKVISEGGLPACHCDSAGTIRGLVFRNIRSASDMGVGLQSHDDAHPIEGVVFENVDGLGRPLVKGKVEWKSTAAGR